MPHDYDHIAEVISRLVVEAGVICLNHWQPMTKDTHTHEPYMNEHWIKDDGSPVTIADKEADQLIKDKLEQIFPKILCISEESFDDYSKHKDHELEESFFLVDPLDGTKQFIAGKPEFTVNIGYIENGLPRLGAICAPSLGETFMTTGEGLSWKIDKNGQAKPLRCQDIKPDHPNIVASSSHFDEKTKDYINRVKQNGKILNYGSSLKIAKIAEGLADIYPRFGPTWPWDIAAGHAVLRGAGGEIFESNGKAKQYSVNITRNRPFLAVGGAGSHKYIQEFTADDSIH